jgi:hypothetical protein
MISYEKERLFKATVIAKYAEEGFTASVRKVGQMLLEEEDIEEIPHLLESLLLEYQALQEVNEDLKRVRELYAEREGENNDQN